MDHRDNKRLTSLVDVGTICGASDASADFEDAALGDGLAGAAVAAVGVAAAEPLGAIGGIPEGSIGIAAGGITGLALGCVCRAAFGGGAERMLGWPRRTGCTARVSGDVGGIGLAARSVSAGACRAYARYAEVHDTTMGACELAGTRCAQPRE